MYIISYSICIVLGLFMVGIGAITLVALGSDGLFIGLFLMFLGLFLLGASIYWLIYFIRLPEYSITYKDGKLNFRNKLECTPDRLQDITGGSWGIDGAIFSYGRITVTVDGKKYKFNFISNQQEVINRLYAIRNEYIAKNNAAYFAYQAQQQAQAQAQAAAQTEATPAAAEPAEPATEAPETAAETPAETPAEAPETPVTETPAPENTEAVEEVAAEEKTTTGTEEDNG